MSVTEGEALALEGMSRAVNAAHTKWVAMARWCLDQYIAEGKPFTSEDVLGFLDDLQLSTGDKRALGGIMRCARDDGRIRMVGYVRAQRPERHAAPVAQWVKA